MLDSSPSPCPSSLRCGTRKPAARARARARAMARASQLPVRARSYWADVLVTLCVLVASITSPGGGWGRPCGARPGVDKRPPQPPATTDSASLAHPVELSIARVAGWLALESGSLRDIALCAMRGCGREVSTCGKVSWDISSLHGQGDDCRRRRASAACRR